LVPRVPSVSWRHRRRRQPRRRWSRGRRRRGPRRRRRLRSRPRLRPGAHPRHPDRPRTRLLRHPLDRSPRRRLHRRLHLLLLLLRRRRRRRVASRTFTLRPHPRPPARRRRRPPLSPRVVVRPVRVHEGEAHVRRGFEPQRTGHEHGAAAHAVASHPAPAFGPRVWLEIVGILPVVHSLDPELTLRLLLLLLRCYSSPRRILIFTTRAVDLPGCPCLAPWEAVIAPQQPPNSLAQSVKRRER
jgi:hypothetical protein